MESQLLCLLTLWRAEGFLPRRNVFRICLIGTITLSADTLKQYCLASKALHILRQGCAAAFIRLSMLERLLQAHQPLSKCEEDAGLRLVICEETDCWEGLQSLVCLRGTLHLRKLSGSLLLSRAVCVFVHWKDEKGYPTYKL